MRGRSLTGFLAAASVVGLIGVTLLTLPQSPRPLTAPRTPLATDIAGAYHVHSTRSDGTGSIDDIARAAAAAGLKFVILADHGDGTRPVDPPRYVHGVLVIDAVEISTAGGHYVALGLGRTPFRLAGEPRDVVEDVRRFGGFGIVAHPGSLKPELAWQAWATPFDGIEWLNADSEWRDERLRSILWALWHYPIRPSASVATILDRPTQVLERWDRALRRRPVVSLAAVDAHARLGRLGNASSHEAVGRTLLAVPSYEASFRTFSTRVQLPAPMSGEPRLDAEALVSAIRNGRVYSVVDSIAAPGRFAFAARSGAARAEMGGRLVLDGSLELRVDADVPTGSRIVILRDGNAIRTGGKSTVVRSARRRGVYRVEIRTDGAPGSPSVPWILSNPIAVVETEDTSEARAPRPERAPAQVRSTAATVEHDPSSSMEFAREIVDTVPVVRLRYRLGGGERHSQYAALVLPRQSGIPPRFDRLSFSGSAGAPMRLSVQLRSQAGERWQRSVYLDATPRNVRVEFDEFAHALRTGEIGRPPLDGVRAILFVVDTVNTAPGSSGIVTIERLRLSR
jgi:hypothetical protein